MLDGVRGGAAVGDGVGWPFRWWCWVLLVCWRVVGAAVAVRVGVGVVGAVAVRVGGARAPNGTLR